MKILLFFLLAFLCLSAFAKQAMPLELELNKTTTEELAKKYKIIKKEPNYWQGYNYFIDIENIESQNFSKALVICNDFNIVEAIILTADGSRFEEFYEILENKYNLINKEIDKKGNKMATFTNNNCVIILESSASDENMELVYITNNFYQEFLNKLSKEEQLKHNHIENLL